MQRSNHDISLPAGGSMSGSQASGGLARNGYAAPPFPGSYVNQPVMPGGQPEKAWPTITELVNALKRRLVLATFLGVLVGVAAASAVWLALPHGKHKVRSLVHVRPVNGIITNQETINNFDDFKKTQERLVRTRRVLDHVLQDTQVSRLPLVAGSDDPAQQLDDMIKVSWEAPDLMAVSMSGDDWTQLKVLVDAVVASFLAYAKSEEALASTNRKKELQAVLKGLDDKIASHRKNIEREQKLGKTGSDPATQAHLIAALTADSNLVAKEIHDEEAAIRLLNITTQKHRQNLNAMDTMPLDVADLEVAAKSDKQVQDKQAAIAVLEQRLKATSEQVDGGPIITNLQANLRKAKDDLNRTLEALRPTVEKAYRADKKRAINIQLTQDTEILDIRKQTLASLQGVHRLKEQQLNDLRVAGNNVKIEDDDLKPLLEQRNDISRKLIEATVNANQDTRMRKQEEAIVMLHQNVRQKVLVALGAFAGGTLLVLAAVGFLEWRSRRVDSVDQVVNELGMRVIGTIPAFPSKQSLKSGDAAQSQNWRFVLNESVNSARTMLLHTAKTQNMQVLMVTSAMQGEGKTSLASQLATSMATAGLRTLILDCDLRNPSMHKLFDAPLTPGCSEVLCQEVDVSDAVQPTTVPNLWLIPAGQCSNRVISALAQGHPLETLFNRLRGQFDFIVVDSCPVLPVADTLLVGQHVDGVVLSILQDISQLPKVQTTAERLTQLNIPLLGTVVNGIKPDVHAYGYNYVKQLPA